LHEGSAAAVGESAREIEAVLIAGPTASGKSALALDVARAIGGAVVNADSMQVYRDLRVLTARPTVEEEATAPHRLYGTVDAAQPYSVGGWLEDAAQTLRSLRREGRTPIFVGGTGLYFKALLEGLSPVPEIPPPVRAAWRARLERDGSARLHALLVERDPETARQIRPSDPQRVVRALEVLEATGRPLAEWQRRPGTPLLERSRVVPVVLAPDREWLHRRIETRFERMVEEGALREVELLAARSLDPALPVMKAHGALHLARALAGEIDLAEARNLTNRDVRSYAKRQETWFRHQMADWDKLWPDEAGEWLKGSLRGK
jgi:tRNA dimethylallyltransferase